MEWNHAKAEIDFLETRPSRYQQDHKKYASSFLMEEYNMTHDLTTPNNSLFSPIPY